MRHLPRPDAARTFIPPLGALLWGAVELLALARSRWAARWRATRGA